MHKKKEQMMQLFKLSIPIIILICIYQKGKDYFKKLDWELVLEQIPKMQTIDLVVIIFLGFVASGFMIYYDVLFNKKLKLNIPFLKLVKYSWIANTFNNFFGFGGLTGASIRTALFRRHHSEFKEMLKMIAWSTPLMLTGVSVLLIFVLIGGIENFIHIKKIFFLQIFLLGIVFFLPIYLWVLARKNKLKDKEDKKFVLHMVFASIIEWFFCFVVFYVISRSLEISVPFTLLYGMFFVGKFVGIVSMTPGGVGTFDFVILQGLEQQSVEPATALLLILLYRISYFIFPWIVGAILGMTELGKEWLQFSKKLVSNSEKTFSTISHKILTCFVFISGCILMVPIQHEKVINQVQLARHFFPDCWLELSLEISTVIGFILILLSRAVYAKIKMSFYGTFIALLLGSLFSLSRGFEYRESLFLLGIALLLWLSKNKFIRKNYALKWEELFCWLLLLLSFFVYYFYTCSQVNPTLRLWGILRHTSNEILILVLFILIGLYVSFPRIKKITMTDNRQKEKVLKHLEQYKGNVLSHLVFLDDKYIHWSENKNVLFIYQTIADKIIVLGEPIGEPNEVSKAIDDFQKYADIYGMTVIFYQIEKENLAMYHEKGYSFFKLGEESLVDFRHFTLAGKKGASLRTKINRFSKMGYTFEVIQPPFEQDFMKILKNVSDDWLGKKKEKGFSMGYFHEEYLQMSPIAILKDNQGNVIAFSNLTPVYNSNKTLAIDLMRFQSNSPVGTMDVLFCHILEWAKQQNYDWFDLRMAPLANVGTSDFCFLSEKVAYKFYVYGGSLYGFSGLRRYKEKFATNWDPRYLAYRSKTTFTLTMFQISLVIQNSKKLCKKKK